MKEIEIKKKIVCLGEEFSEYEMKNVNNIDFDLFVYKYESGSYEGSGFSVGKKGDKYFYHELGHCSCNGPTDGIATSQNALLSLKEIEEVAEKSYGGHAKEVMEYIKRNEQN